MTIKLKKTDVVVVGLGAAGGVAILPLAQAGLEVVGLEAGRWMKPEEFIPDELRNIHRGWPSSVQKASKEIPTERPDADSPTRSRAKIHPMMNAVGGTSVHYWAQSWRLNPWDFKARSRIAKRYGENAIPSGSTLEDWPLSYQDLEPYYEKVEKEIGVSGKAGNIGGVIDRHGNIFEGSRQREYPMPPLRGSGFTDRMTEAARSLGWHPFPGPAAVNSRVYQGRSGCVYHGACWRGGCHVGAKGSTAVTTIPKAQRTGNLQVVTHTQVVKIAIEGDGRAGGVHYIKEGREYFQPASAVLLACYTYENTRLLLLSKSKAYSHGLSNNHGQVGKHFFGHTSQWGGVTALFPWNLNTWYGLPAQGSAVDDWADDNFDHTGLGFVGGSNLFVSTERHPIQAARVKTFGMAPSWGSGWKAFIKDNANRWANVYTQTSTFPYEDHFLDLDPQTKDPLGFPVCRITFDMKENERRASLFAQEKAEQWFKEAGAIQTIRSQPAADGLTTHAYGGTRMGEDSDTSVVDGTGFSHEVPNLGILGASIMGTSGAHNPTLTVQALAWRTADHLVRNWQSIVA